MKTNILNFILIGTLFLTGVVSAFEEPSAGFPKGEANAPVHIGTALQAKSGQFWARIIKSGLAVPLPSSAQSIIGFFAADEALVSPQGFFTRILLPGNQSFLRVGTTTNSLYDSSISTGVPLTVDLSGRVAGGSPNSRDALAIMAGSGVCTPHVNFITNTPALRLVSNVNNGGNADILARQIQLSGGSPAAGKVLVSFDSQGNAVWGIPKMVKSGSNWVLSFDYNESPVVAGQNICKPNPILGCTDQNATNYNPNATQDNGTCTYPPKGYWDIVDSRLNNAGVESGSLNIGGYVLSYQNRIGKTCDQFFNTSGYGNKKLRVVEYTNQYSNFNDRRNSNPNRRLLMLPLGSFLADLDKTGTIQNNVIPGRIYPFKVFQGFQLPPPPLPITNDTPIKPGGFISPENSCLYQAEIIYRYPVTTQEVQDFQNNKYDPYNLYQHDIDFHTRYKSECRILPRGQKPPANERWNTSYSGNKNKQWVPTVSCTEITKNAERPEGNIGPLTNADLEAAWNFGKTYQLQYFKEQ